MWWWATLQRTLCLCGVFFMCTLCIIRCRAFLWKCSCNTGKASAGDDSTANKYSYWFLVSFSFRLQTTLCMFGLDNCLMTSPASALLCCNLYVIDLYYNAMKHAATRLHDPLHPSVSVRDRQKLPILMWMFLVIAVYRPMLCHIFFCCDIIRLRVCQYKQLSLFCKNENYAWRKKDERCREVLYIG